VGQGGLNDTMVLYKIGAIDILQGGVDRIMRLVEFSLDRFFNLLSPWQVVET